MKSADRKRLAEIAKRGAALLNESGASVSPLDVMMDLEFAHEDIPLDFEKLAGFDDGDFGHDISGIYCHFNRQTKRLEDCFVPRCAVNS